MEDELKIRKWFGVVSEEEKIKYGLTQDLVEYVNFYIKKVIPLKKIDPILHSKPVPSNIEEVPHLDSFVNEVLPDKRIKINYFEIENTLGKLQSKKRGSYGSLAEIYQYLEDLFNGKDETLDVDMDILIDSAFIRSNHELCNIRLTLTR